MNRLDPGKLNVTYLTGTTPEHMKLPRRYTLTHSDRTGKLFLSIGSEFNTGQCSSIYTRLMRDEALTELCDEGTGLVFKVYCHVSGGFVIGTAKWRYSILQSEMPLVLETIRYGDRVLFERNPGLDEARILVHFASSDDRFNVVEDWGTMLQHR